MQPLSLKRNDIVNAYQEFFDELLCCPFGSEEAFRFAEIRVANPTVKPSDAIQLARVDLFITNDRRLSQLEIKDVTRVISLSEWNSEQIECR